VDQNKQHKFVHGQMCNVDSELFSGRVEIKALLPVRCAEHNLLKYGCSAGDACFSFCENSLKPLTTTQKRSMN
jgi:hypothetical protein